MKNFETDVLLIGGGIMSATLGALLQQLDPNLTITMVEQLSEVALESSNALNNAGTGHAGYCELNYTPQALDGSINITRACEINAAFEVSLQFWAHMINIGALPTPENFINRTPHLSFVWGNKGVTFLKQRVDLLKAHHLFADMQYSEDFAQLQAWMPLMMADMGTDVNAAPKKATKMAASYVSYGSDVDFGALTRYMVTYLSAQKNFTLLTQTKVKKLNKVKKAR